MRKADLHRLISGILAILGILAFSGCGAGQSSGNSGNPGETGTYAMGISWPGRTIEGKAVPERVIPYETETIQVVLEGDGLTYLKN